MTKKLQISDTLSLPLDAATRRMAILAMSGAGKSNAAVVLAEAMYDAGIPWFAIDPKGDWHGVRAGADGKAGGGLKVPIFGGLHGDLPLEPSSGRYIAKLLVEQRLSCVLDVSEFDDRQDLWRFVADLGESLLRLNREVLHGFFEEADDYIPQTAKAGGNLNRCLGVMQRYVKRGRFRALGCTMITQRSAALNKDALYQAELMIALRCTGKGDREAIRGWVDHSGAAGAIVESLPTLADGEGWVSSPAWLRDTKRITFRRRRTYDSGATPTLVGGKRAAVTTLADVDLDAIRVQMQDAIERAKAEDPRELQKALAAEKAAHAKTSAELERAKAKPAPAAKEAKPREVPVLDGKQRQAVERLVRELADVRAEAGGLVQKLGPLLACADDLQRRLNAALAAKPETIPVRSMMSGRVLGHVSNVRMGVDRAAGRDRTVVHAGPGDASLPEGERKVLAAILPYDGATREQITLRTGYKRSTRDAYIQRLGVKRLVELHGDVVRGAEAAAAALGTYEPMPTGDRLRERYLTPGELPEGERKVLEVVCDRFPEGCDREKISEITGFKRSTRDAYVQRLGVRKLVYAAGGIVTASSELFS
ncbi:MAG TPA: DUF87 domain-containing protein [Polyangiales bacterium]|nr:DUF87 domain-containing protein [Polyangiales bacterium]